MTVHVARLTSDVRPIHGLGRHVEHDTRSRGFAFELGSLALPLHPVEWTHSTPVLNQFNTEGCTGNAFAQCLNCDVNKPLRDKLGKEWFTEGDALTIYGDAQHLDGLHDPSSGYYPSTDDGSSGLGAAKACQQLGYLTGYQHTFSFQQFLGALATQPVCVGTSWTNCVVPDTRVLTADLEWLPIQKLEPGAQLIGFDEDVKRGSRYRQATVLTNDRIVEPCVEILTDRGSVVTSVGHLFVQRGAKVARRWRRADQLVPGSEILFLAKPWDEDRSWEGGWLSGFYDGEGCLSNTRLGNYSNYGLYATQKAGPEMDLCLKLLAAKGFDYGTKITHGADTTHSQVHQWYLRGGLEERLRFLGQVRPQRLLAVANRTWEGGEIRRRGNVATVQEIRPIGDQEVMAIGTSAGTLVTDGFLSHNSMENADANGLVTVGSLDDSNVSGGHEYLAVGFNPGDKLVKFLNSWGSDWGVDGFFYVTYSDFQRLLDAQGDVVVPKVAG